MDMATAEPKNHAGLLDTSLIVLRDPDAARTGRRERNRDVRRAGCASAEGRTPPSIPEDLNGGRTPDIVASHARNQRKT